MLSQLENLLYKIRDFFWKYPDFLIGRENSVFSVFSKTYIHSRPFSHIAATIFVTVTILSLMTQDVASALRINRQEYVEGVVTGVDPDTGRLVTISKINPFIQTSVQLERDLNEIIYEPLINVSSDGKVNNVLAESVKEVKPGAEYVITLKQNVFWHDGSKFTSEDVVKTHGLLKELNTETSTQSAFSKSAQKIELEKLDDYTVSFLTLDNGIIPNFYEVISYKILPAIYISELNKNNITTDQPEINRNPIGTGPFKLESSGSNQITLTRFNDYHSGIAKLKNLKFLPFEDEESALKALKAGQIHGLAGLTINSVKSTNGFSHLTQYKSSTLYSQYWAIYMNLRQEEGPTSLKNVKVRQAIAYATNKSRVLEELDNKVEIAYGPIPRSSFAFKKDIQPYDFDRAKAIELLTSDGWLGEPRKKEDVELKFTLTYVDNVDRNKIAESIKQDLGAVGIEITLNPLTLKEVNEDYILPRRYELLLYGVSTFVDPDRYELFHSKEKNHPGLNITGYESGRKTKEIIKGENGKAELVEIPKADSLLQDGRGVADPTKRKEIYVEFQELLSSESPVVFLYHPTFTYIVNQRIKGVDLQNVNSIEERFLKLVEWEIAV